MYTHDKYNLLVNDEKEKYSLICSNLTEPTINDRIEYYI